MACWLSAEAACTHYLDAFSAHAHGGGNGHLRSAAERNAGFQLAGNAVGNQLRIQLGTLDLEDVDLNILAGDLLQLFFQLIDLLAAFTNHDTRAGRVHGNGDELQGTFDDYFRHASLGQTHGEILADFIVLNQLVSVLAAAVPIGVPSADDAETIAYRVCFLSHEF